MAHDEGQACVCVADHNPNPMELHRHHVLPLAWGGPDTGIVFICPTTHSNTHELLRAYMAAGGPPPWDVRRRFGPYVRRLAADGWEQWLNTRT